MLFDRQSSGAKFVKLIGELKAKKGPIWVLIQKHLEPLEVHSGQFIAQQSSLQSYRTIQRWAKEFYPLLFSIALWTHSCQNLNIFLQYLFWFTHKPLYMLGVVCSILTALFIQYHTEPFCFFLQYLFWFTQRICYCLSCIRSYSLLYDIPGYVLQVKAFKVYEKDKKPVDLLSDEDKFMMQVWL